MSKFKTYEDCTIKVIQKTICPNALVREASDITQKIEKREISNYNDEQKLIKYLLKANHTSIFEHCYITVLISNVSRSFLAQITRHRMGSFTSASQHYQEYDEYPNIMCSDMQGSGVKHLLKRIDEVYAQLIREGIPKEEARQILPNAKAVNLMWTVNARALVNFLNLRMCKRNVTEMFMFANKMSIVAKEWFPSLFDLVGPDCTMTECKQGKMKADQCKSE